MCQKLLVSAEPNSQNGEDSREKCCAGHTIARSSKMGCKGQGEDAISSSLVRKPREKITFEQGVEGTEEMSQNAWKNFPGRRGSRYKGPVVKACLVCL